ISFSYSDSRRLMAQFFSREDFLLIYRVDAAHFSPVGKPYNPDIEPNFVDANLPSIMIYPLEKSSAVLGFNWFSDPENQPLDIGQYYSSFKDKAVIENVEINIDTTIKFEIK